MSADNNRHMNSIYRSAYYNKVLCIPKALHYRKGGHSCLLIDRCRHVDLLLYFQLNANLSMLRADRLVAMWKEWSENYRA